MLRNCSPRASACAARPWAQPLKIGQRGVPKDRALADLLGRVVPAIALLAFEAEWPDASAADPCVPPVNGCFFRGFLRRHGGPQRARIMSISGSSPGPPRRASGASGAHQEHDAPQRAGISDVSKPGARKKGAYRGLLKCLETLRESRSLKRLEI